MIVQGVNEAGHAVGYSQQRRAPAGCTRPCTDRGRRWSAV